ncbi:serine protease Do [Pedobacter africanus]|uniref:S1-C subfamily serine protease n=1 Tax=Pedobacter africanus TaxID=151894 RepID=A0ACC6L3N8_9SPHI|nr:serine protease [Pedobacter africanus]MDR6786109.1 S1-C subfamily serine protease [Pedobacter africanus]
MKRCLLFGICLWLSVTAVKGQSRGAENEYVKYNEFIGEALREGFMSGKESKSKTIKEIRAASALLVDEKEPMEAVTALKGKSKVLDGEEIFKQRKRSVFIFGKILSSDPKALKFDLSGTAFAIAGDGVCITNYHVLKDLIGKDGPTSKDSIYFLMSADKKIYRIDRILAFSQNNDLAVFKVDTHGEQLSAIPIGRPANTGAPVYCLSHPLGHFYYFSKGIMARNVAVDSLSITYGYNKNGKAPVRMEITADYGVGSSGGPILDKYGNLIGVVTSTHPVGTQGGPGAGSYIQMMVKETIPVKALIDLLGTNLNYKR